MEVEEVILEVLQLPLKFTGLLLIFIRAQFLKLPLDLFGLSGHFSLLYEETCCETGE